MKLRWGSELCSLCKQKSSCSGRVYVATHSPVYTGLSLLTTSSHCAHFNLFWAYKVLVLTFQLFKPVLYPNKVNDLMQEQNNSDLRVLLNKNRIVKQEHQLSRYSDIVISVVRVFGENLHHVTNFQPTSSKSKTCSCTSSAGLRQEPLKLGSAVLLLVHQVLPTTVSTRRRMPHFFNLILSSSVIMRRPVLDHITQIQDSMAGVMYSK